MGKQTNAGNSGITTGGDVSLSGTGIIVIGNNNRVASYENISAKEINKTDLLNSLEEFQKKIAKLDLPEDELSTIKDDVKAAIKETKKKEPDPLKIKNWFKGAIEKIIQVGNTIDTVSKWEWTKKIMKILGLTLLH